MCPDTNSPEDSGKSYDGKNNHSQHFTDKNHNTGAPDLHICPLTRCCRAQCLAWKGSHRPGGSKTELPAALRWFAKHHNWHEPAYLGNQLKLRLVFREPVLAATHQLLAKGRDGLAERVWEDFKRLRKMIKPLDNTGIRQIIDEDELETLEHTKATAARRMNELADLIEIGDQPRKTQNAQKPPKEDSKTEWITYQEAAKLLFVDKSTVSRWVQRGILESNGKKGRRRRVSKGIRHGGGQCYLAEEQRRNYRRRV
jgi:excisionase family DNA binding protein